MTQGTGGIGDLYIKQQMLKSFSLLHRVVIDTTLKNHSEILCINVPRRQTFCCEFKQIKIISPQTYIFDV